MLTRALPPTFTATARLLPPQSNSSTAPVIAHQAGGQAGLGLSAMGAKVPSDLYAQLFYSRSVQDPVIASHGLLAHYGVDTMDDARARLGAATVASVGRGGIIELAVHDRDAAQSAALANGLIDAMYDMGRRITQEAAHRQQAFYDQLIAETRLRLGAADEQLLALERTSGLTRLRGQEEASSGSVVELRGLLTTREVDLAKMLSSATAQHPEVKRMRAEVAALRERLVELERPRAATNDSAGLLVAPIDYPHLRRAVEPARREVESLALVLQELLKARESTRIDDARDFTTIAVLDRAVIPKRRSAPVATRLAASAFSGAMLLALLFALWRTQRAVAPAAHQVAGAVADGNHPTPASLAQRYLSALSTERERHGNGEQSVTGGQAPEGR